MSSKYPENGKLGLRTVDVKDLDANRVHLFHAYVI